MEYFSPGTVSETLGLLKLWKGRARLVGGGTNLIPDMRAKSIKPAVLIDLSRLKNLVYIKEENARIRIGGLTSIAELASSKILRQKAPILFQAARELGNPLVRNRATVAGNLADASPAADTAVPLLALGAKVSIQGGGRSREVALEEFFLGPRRTVLKNDELIREIHFSKGNSSQRMGYLKLGLRTTMAISVVTAALWVELEKDQCRRIRISLGAVAPRPLRSYQTERMLTGKKVTPELIAACGVQVAKEISPLTDIRATAEYRRSMAAAFLERLIRETFGVEEK